MGLDMYLKAKIYLGSWNDEGGRKEKVRALFPEIKSTGNIDSVEVEFEVAYWRKVNAIHKWFVINCQEGVDKCQNTYISREKLKELLEDCKAVLKEKDRAVELLPTKEGFFFGGTDYDEYYWESIEYTINAIEYCLQLPDDFSFEYHSSW